MTASSLIASNFIGQLSTIEGARFLFLIDADRAHLFDTLPNESNDLKTLKNAAGSINAIVIDPTDAFREFVSKSGRMLEVGPYDRHWNRDAIQLLADVIARELFRTGHLK